MAIPLITPYSIRLGVVGAGTMGSGIALAALQANMIVTLYDVSTDMLEKARDYAEKHLSRKNLAGNLRNLQLTNNLDNLGGAGVVIEAVPEELRLKLELFAQLDRLCAPPAILATNTSTLPVTAIAAAAQNPERVAGMHFFNPAPVLPLVEVVRAARTNPGTIQTLMDLAQLMGKTPVVTKDTPGFIVNRVARPFYGEALRLLGEGVATHADIDRLMRLGGGFRMGPFQLMDLIGIDINLAATQSMFSQTFEEPRYRPHAIQAQMVQQGALGRKTGRGFYSYENEPVDEETLSGAIGKGSGAVLVGQGSWAPGFAELRRQAGYTIANGAHERIVAGAVLAGRGEGLERLVIQMDRELPPEAPLLCQCVDITLTEVATFVRHPERLVGFDGLFFANGRLATLVASPILNPKTRLLAEAFINSLGRSAVWVQDSPALVLPRIVAMLANEAAFALSEGVAEQATIDKAMQLGTNYPKGPLAWANELGYDHILGVLDHLQSEFREERYRAAPLLRKWVRLRHIAG